MRCTMNAMHCDVCSKEMAYAGAFRFHCGFGTGRVEGNSVDRMQADVCEECTDALRDELAKIETIRTIRFRGAASIDDLVALVERHLADLRFSNGESAVEAVRGILKYADRDN